MPPALAAAHIGHEIEHSSAFMGFLVGAAVGLLAGAAIVAATVLTGGAALAVVAAVGGAVAATGGGALAGMYIGEAIKNPKGPISSGSPDVFYGAARIPAARAVIDTVACKDHGTKFLATGSDSVFINTYPAVRDDDKSECDGTVKSGFDNIFIGAETMQYLEIESEVPEWMVDVAMGMVIVGTAVALTFGAAAAFAAGGLCALGTFGLQVAGGLVGAAILAPVGGMIGEALGGELGKRIGETAGGLLGGGLGARAGGLFGRRTLTGHPVDVATGELVTQETDFVISGLVGLAWERSWISSSTQDGALGRKWHHPFDMALAEAESCQVLRVEKGRLVLLPRLEVGQSFWHRAESLLATRLGTEEWVIRRDDGLHYRLAAPGPDGGLRLVEISDGNGNRIAADYDAAGHLAQVTGSDGIRYLFDSDAAGRFTRISKTDGQVALPLVGYDYDASGDLIRATDAAGQAFAYAYDRHLLIRETRKSGLSFHFAWDDPSLGGEARCIRTWGDGDIYWRALDYRPGETRVTNGKGAVETYFYNEIGLVTRMISPLGAESGCTINRFGECEAAVDPNGAVSRWRFDAFGRLVEAVDPLGAATRLAYASDDPRSPNFLNLAEETDPLGAAMEFEYDARGNLTGFTDQAGHRIRTLRDARGLMLSVQDDLGVLARYSWSEAGHLLAERNGRGGRVSYAYDGFGLLLREQPEDEAATTFAHDALGRVTRIERECGARLLGYSPDGLLARLTEPDGTTWRWDFDGLPLPVRRHNPDGSSFRYDYDSELNLVRLLNELGEEYRLEYDLAEQLVLEQGFDGHTLRYDYDPAGHLIGQRDARRRHLFRRDALGRLLRRDSGDGGWAEYAYDLAGRMVLALNAARRVTFRHDPRGLVLGENQDGAELAHSYSGRGERLATVLPDGRILHFGYDRDGSFERFSFGGREVLSLARDRMGRETLREAGRLAQQTEYDPQGRIRRQLAWRAGKDRPVFSRTYRHDANGRVRGIDDLLRGARDYLYDAREQLRRVDGAAPETFFFDPAGNIAGPSADGRDVSIRGGRLLMRGDCHYEYDDAGNRILLRRGHAGSHVFRYGYDDLDQLVAVHEDRGRTSRSTEFRYDALGRRVWKRHREILRAANDPGGDAIAEHVRDETTWFLWDDMVLLAEGKGDAQGARDPLAVVYVHEPASFRPLAQIRRHDPAQEGEVLVYWLDHLGTPQEISNEKGELVWQVALKAWGGIDRPVIERVENNLRFPGQYHDVETGLHYNRHRHYDPDIGGFVNQDPIRLLGGEKLALYAPNPLSWTDPLGLDPDDWNDYQRRNSGRGWSPAQMRANYRKTREWRTNNPVSDGTHGNSHATTKPAYGYILRDRDTHQPVKFGETTERNPFRRYSQSYYDKHNVYMDPVKKGTKQQMHQWQHERIVQYKNRHGFRPRLNLCDY
ncbi:RHS repeat-associated core domain-containing protein [Paracoccus aminovorans]|uniref:RHS repeat-associated core domain-containing protein n=1 Tax=Paracoccus aminovorans TaxID=34004 RepID=A0A1I2ZPM0_9RHOB|nr:RHS repeat-associated core domain-containing protein [Paracoccus aminovorans]CQR84156.1 Rhs family protein [Paracoccus aminovorans]SFH39793.1 RHS repeat-associated core domain-containing protein [Paracoccus aminovorans]